MTASLLRVELKRNEVDYLKAAGFLPLALLQHLEHVIWRSAVTGTLEVSAATAEKFRDTFTEQLARAGFDDKYRPTTVGGLLEDLIDRFHEGDGSR